jgi:hypothetical protein
VRVTVLMICFGLHYKFIVVQLLLILLCSSIQYDQRAIPFQLNFSRLLPDMFARWDLKKSENLTYNFNVRNGFNDVNALVNVLHRYREIHKKNSPVTSHRLNYSKYNLYIISLLIE